MNVWTRHTHVNTCSQLVTCASAPVSKYVLLRRCAHTHTCTHIYTPLHTHFSTAALAGVLPPGLGINNPLWGFYTFTFLFPTYFKVLFRVRSEDWGPRGWRVEKQEIWKIPVIFELFPKTPTGATVRPAAVQLRLAPLPGSRPPVVHLPCPCPHLLGPLRGPAGENCACSAQPSPDQAPMAVRALLWADNDRS